MLVILCKQHDTFCWNISFDITSQKLPSALVKIHVSVLMGQSDSHVVFLHKVSHVKVLKFTANYKMWCSLSNTVNVPWERLKDCKEISEGRKADDLRSVTPIPTYPLSNWKWPMKDLNIIKIIISTSTSKILDVLSQTHPGHGWGNHACKLIPAPSSHCRKHSYFVLLADRCKKLE